MGLKNSFICAFKKQKKIFRTRVWKLKYWINMDLSDFERKLDINVEDLKILKSRKQNFQRPSENRNWRNYRTTSSKQEDFFSNGKSQDYKLDQLFNRRRIPLGHILISTPREQLFYSKSDEFQVINIRNNQAN